MSDTASTLSRLVSLLEQAQALAAELGPSAGTATGLLDAALTAAKAVEARGGEPDEGIRLDALTTDNDK